MPSVSGLNIRDGGCDGTEPYFCVLFNAIKIYIPGMQGLRRLSYGNCSDRNLVQMVRFGNNVLLYIISLPSGRVIIIVFRLSSDAPLLRMFMQCAFV